jgi:hypothetical protein
VSKWAHLVIVVGIGRQREHGVSKSSGFGRLWSTACTVGRTHGSKEGMKGKESQNFECRSPAVKYCWFSTFWASGIACRSVHAPQVLMKGDKVGYSFKGI